MCGKNYWWNREIKAWLWNVWVKMLVWTRWYQCVFPYSSSLSTTINPGTGARDHKRWTLRSRKEASWWLGLQDWRNRTVAGDLVCRHPREEGHLDQAFTNLWLTKGRKCRWLIPRLDQIGVSLNTSGYSDTTIKRVWLGTPRIIRGQKRNSISLWDSLFLPNPLRGSDRRQEEPKKQVAITRKLFLVPTDPPFPLRCTRRTGRWEWGSSGWILPHSLSAEDIPQLDLQYPQLHWRGREIPTSTKPSRWK